MNQKTMETKEDNHFISVPAKINRINHFLVDGKRVPFPPELKFYYGYFYTWAIQVDKVCPSKEHIAEQMGESKPTAMKRVKKLVDLGLLRIEVEGRKHVYYLKMPDEVIKMPHGTITAKAVDKKPKAVKERPAQELTQQTATKPALPSNDEDVPDFSRAQIHCEQQTESPPETQKEEIAKTVSVYPWGSLAVCKSNGQVKEDVKQWALSQTGGDVSKAESLVSEIVNEKTGGDLKYSFKCEGSVYDDFNVPF